VLREKVEKAALSLGYQRNRIAGSLRGLTTDLIAVIVPSMSNSVFPNIIDGIDEALQDSPLQPVLGMTKYNDVNEETILRDLMAWNPAGVILSGLEHTEGSQELLARFAGPIVQVMDTDGKAIDMAVGISMESAGRLMAKHFFNKGYRRVGYVGAWGERPKRSLKRRLAFASELQNLGIPLAAFVILEEQSSMANGALGIKKLLEQDKSVDAVFFANDDLAVGALFYCQSQGISVPEQIALAGFNGLEMCQSILPRLTTISTPRHEMGRLAGEMIQRTISGETISGPKVQRLKLDLIVGETT
jgi:LacI family gluconate utilization system Gnt-I transcriptional repressor